MALRYLNHAGTSYPKPDGVHTAVARALRTAPSSWGALYDEALNAVLMEFGGEQNSDWQLRFTSGCTAGLALTLQGLPWTPGDRLVTSALEHHALAREAIQLAHRGVERVSLPYVPARGVEPGDLAKELERGGVKVVAVTACSNVTGEVLPLAELGALTRETGALLVVDAAQSFGTDLFSACTEHADVIVAAGHKWARGPRGIGLVAARRHVRFSCPSAACEIGEAAESTFFSFCDAGSVNLEGALGLAAGLGTDAASRRQRGEHMRGLAAELREALAARDDVRLLGPSKLPVNEQSPVVSFVPERLSLERAETHFLDRKLVVRAGTHCAPEALVALGAPEGCVRISFGVGSNTEDVQRVLSALDEVG